jgi:hypothetical protein
MKPPTTRTLDVTATGSGTNGIDISARLPIRNLTEALDQVANRVHITPE